MRSKKRTIGILIVVIVILLGFASSLLVYRNKLSSEKTKNNSNNNTAQSLSSAPSGISIENFYDKPITDEKIALDSIEVNRDKLGYSDKNFTFIYDEKSSSETAYHFDLYYKDIPVYSPVGIRGVSVITHIDNSAKVLITGVSDSQNITKVNTTPKITQDEASKIIKNELNLSEKTYIEPKLIIYEVNEECILAYYVNTLFNVCIINAENGNIVVCQSTLLSNSDEFIGQNGDKHRIFYDDYQDGNYNIENALWDKEKNIFIYNNICTYEEIKMKENILSLEDIQSGKNKSAVDGMANTYRAVEYFEKLNKELGSIFDLICVNVNAELEDKNGNIIQNQAMGGYHKIDGNDICILSFCVMSDDATPQFSAYLDAVAHEYTHAVTNLKVFGSDGHSEDRRYFERNALQEAYSDIFGELVEQRYTGETDWNSNKTRNLINQEKGKDYKNYKNYYRYNYDDRYIGTSDDGGAHYNSTIISHAAYLMSKDHKSIKHSSYGSTKNLLDYNQLAQLWYGSLEYLKKTEFKDFADCRYAVEESARDLIEKGVLIDGNLKIIEQAFNEVEVSSNPARRGAMDSAEIKENHTLVVPIEDETQSTEFVEITEVPTEPETTTVDISYEGEYGNLRYLVQDGEVIITGCSMQDMTNIEIPPEIDGFPVTTIGNGAFYGENLVSISLPNSIIKIKAGAFDYTPWLEKKREENPIVIENNILISWDKTKNDADVIIPDGVISIAGRVFKDYNMVSVTIPNSLVYIGDEAFSECYDLSNVIMSDSITEIGDKAFCRCTKLTSITIPNGTKIIGDCAFMECEKLANVTIPDSIISVGWNAFGGKLETTPWLEEKRKENPVVVIGTVIIDGFTCNGDVIIPDNVTEIAEGAFSGSELNSITFPDSLVNIGDFAFDNCKNLSSVVIPKNTEEIGESFSFCESLKEIIFLNPKCKIPISRFTIYNQTESEGNYYTEWYYNGVIKGYKNSTAQEYAELYGYEFIEIEN